ncbi:LOW QUALITY PROTEIN: hypothetical protein MAR_032465 [Mya arenaria]|uniref:Uncharacterized protein n=1 Tax=Mya arenaria TaxID=6604 RepID=A0ABY7FAQ1_MYAAR|nr:LOW QUALITY PROTEIN: hypothetical protein MAR_032465 [Mya arenaria]
MTESLQNAYTRFRKQNPGVKVSLSSFKNHRPKEVLTMDKEKFRTCLCEYCLNIEFKLEAINRACSGENLKHLKLKDKFESIEKSMCEIKSGSTNKECYDRKCSSCGIHKITKHFQVLIKKDGEKDVKWKRWELGTRKTGGKECRRQMLVERVGKLITEFSEELKPLARHIFIANWQRQQYSTLVKNVPKDWMVSVADFAENYRCINQDEIQSAYYNYQQSTVFPLIAHYRCPDCDNEIVKESAVFITPDTKHDAEAATQFTRTMDSHIKERINFSHEVQFSDGCAAQFKSKKPFQHLSEEKHTMERCFFGSRHGKSACDALGGLVKNQAERFVKSRRALGNHTLQVIKKIKSTFTFIGVHEYILLRDALCSRLTLYNARRGGEPSRLKISNFIEAKNKRWIDSNKVDNLLEWEKKNCSKTI